MIENVNVDDSKIRKLKEYFLEKAQDDDQNSEEIKLVKDFLCEAFCLVDIKQELFQIQTQNSFEVHSHPWASFDPSQFGSPGNMVSPIAPKKDETIDISQTMLSNEKTGKKVVAKSSHTYQRGPVKTTVTRTTYEVRTSP